MLPHDWCGRKFLRPPSWVIGFILTLSLAVGADGQTNPVFDAAGGTHLDESTRRPDDRSIRHVKILMVPEPA
jgi:hypothetical protein